MSIHIELENLYYEDKKERENVKKSEESILIVHTKERIGRLKKMIPRIDTSEIWNCHYIAYLFQHGETTEDYRLAHEYAKKAVDMGSNVTEWLYAATLDRYLISQGKLQKFGTQFEQVNGAWQQMPVDTSFTDKERISHGVPALKDSLQQFIKKYE
ncbi:hypothetical protein BH09PAT2_BH09PAT2_10430 [soil metagenome]